LFKPTGRRPAFGRSREEAERRKKSTALGSFNSTIQSRGFSGPYRRADPMTFEAAGHFRLVTAEPDRILQVIESLVSSI
jgi:hypothetical protein